MGAINITRVAEKAGVSKATVSNYLNKKQGKVSRETSRRIAQVIQDLNYIPNFGARRLIKRGNTRTVGIILEHASIQALFISSFYGQVHQGISESLRAHDYRVLMIPTAFPHTAENAEYLKELSRGFVDGFMLFNIHGHDIFVETFIKYQIPFMCFGDMRAWNIQNYVGTDYASGVAQAVEYLFSRGIEDIAVSIGSEETIVGRQIKEGYLAGFRKRGIPPAPEFIIAAGGDEMAPIYDDCLRLLGGERPPRAFIVMEGHYYDLAAAARRLNLKLHEGLEAVVVNYSPPAEDGRITYLRAPRYHIGKMAADKLVDLMDGKAVTPHLFSMEFVAGHSQGYGEFRKPA